MSKPLILHVEDDPNDVFLFSRAFKKAELPADLQCFENGESLLTFLTDLASGPDRRMPSLILLDIKLPRVSGFEVLKWLRGHDVFRFVPVVMLTSSAQPDDVRTAYQLGANGYMVKPMDMLDAVSLFSSIHKFWLTLNVTALTPAPGKTAVQL